ncbi:ABC transporter substrate-binding protein [Faunimonas sp. B44]|uniref:ABC transporter substrate-binding protein n=1 Tax=Faunimonas sp. B44 TaxID=3461493 RepID=UPI0040447ABC
MPEGASEVRIGLVRLAKPEPLPISLPARPAPDMGAAGAQLGIEDNNTTGRFTKQHFSLADRAVADEAEALSALDEMAGAGIRFVLADLPAPLLLALADRAAEHGVLVFNTGATDDVLRMEECRANVVHVAPSRAMLADALAQYLVWKQWPRWFLIVGSHEADQRYAEAIRRAAQRFGARIVEERVFEDRGGARTTDSGIAQVQRQLPVFTQNAREHDVVVVADESEVFGPYMPFRTWMPRPVAGTDGLRPTSWTDSHDQWGAIQLQNRFRASARRGMTDHDLQAWTAVRLVGEAATRTGGTDAETMIAFIKGPQMEVAAFKGQKLTIRDWDLQLRQPVLLSDGRNVVTVSPQEGFLHQHSELDTLGYDRPETKCRL